METRSFVDPAHFKILLRKAIFYPLAMAAFLAVLFLIQVQSLRHAARQVNHSQQVIAEARLVERLIIDAETGIRGYIITGMTDFLNPYDLALKQIPVEFNKLSELVADNPAHLARLREVQRAHDIWKGFASQSRIKKSQGIYSAETAKTGRGKAITDDIRAGFNEITRQEKIILDQRSAAADRAAKISLWLGALISLLIGLLLAFQTRGLVLRLSRTYTVAIKSLQSHADELFQSKEWLSTTLHSIGDAVIVVDPEAKVTFLNPIAEHLTGWLLTAAKGLPMDDVFKILNEKSREKAINPVDRVLKEGVIVGLANHTLLVSRDGTERPIEDSAAPIRDRHGKVLGVVLVFRDVSDRYLSERALNDRNERIALAQSVAQVGIFDWNLATEKLIWTNEQQELHGYKAGEYHGTYEEWRKVVHPDDIRMVEENTRRALDADDHYENEYRVIWPDGSVHWILSRGRILRDEAGKSTRVVGANMEVTAKYEASAAIRERETRFQVIADAGPVMIWTTNAQRQCDWLNQAWLKFRGRTMQQEFGQGWMEGIHPEDLERCKEVFTEAFNHREDFEMEYRLQRHDGEYRWVLDKGIPHRRSDGIFLGYVGSCVDIHDLREANRRLEGMAADLQKAVQSRDDFLSISSHELRTPLTSLKLQLQMAQRSFKGDALAVPSPEGLLRTIKLSLGQTERLANLVDDLLDVSRIQSGRLTYQFEETDLASLAHQAVERMQDQFAAGKCEIEVRAAKPVVVSCDRFRIDQVLVNMLSNALKYGPGKPVVVEVSQDSFGGILKVTDQGVGVPKEKQHLIFDRFERAENSTNITGLGLGLFISRQIVLAHGGAISVQSEEGKGSSFIVKLPFQGQPEGSRAAGARGSFG